MTREQRRRAREYEARLAVHEHQVATRKRDNVVWLVALGIVAVVVTVAQIFFFTGGPGPAVEAEETPTETALPEEPVGNSELVPDPALAEARTWTGTLTINGIPLGVELDGAAAPQGVAVQVALTQTGFYDGVSCHRLTTEGLYVLQCGDPEGTGRGGPGYNWGPIENDPADGLYPAGTIAMARVSGDGYSMGSQFFIVYEDTTLPGDAAGGYTVLGQVTSGLDELKEQIVSQGVEGGMPDGKPLVPTTIDTYTLE